MQQLIKVTPKVKNILVPVISVIAGFIVGAIIMLIGAIILFKHTAPCSLAHWAI